MSSKNKIHSVHNRISKAELRTWEGRFFEWQSAVDLGLHVALLRMGLGDHAIDSPKTQFWRDGYNAAAFALRRKADGIRLMKPVQNAEGKVCPDFELRMNQEVLRYEIVEVLAPGRRRDLEIRQDREKGQSRREQPLRQGVELAHMIHLTVRQKSRKSSRYDDVDGLVVVLNERAQLDAASRCAVFHAGTESARYAFSETWIVDHPDQFLLWRDGMYVPLPVQPTGAHLIT